MEREDRMDAFGAASLTGFALFLAFNQIIIKFVNQGLQPVFFAGLRSVIAVAGFSFAGGGQNASDPVWINGAGKRC